MTAVKLSVLVLCVAACGKACDTPGTEPTNLRIGNHGVVFSTTVATQRTYAWNQGDLGDIAVIPGAVDASSLFLRGSYPRELYVFDTPSAKEVGRGISPWQPPQPFHWMNLPGSAYGKKGDASRDIPMGVMMARLVDHGECSRQVPFADFFPALNGALLPDIEAAALKQNSDNRVNQNFASYQPSFLKSVSDFPESNHDGFALRVQYHITRFGVHVETLYIVATYRVLSRDGFFAVELVGDVEVLGPNHESAAFKLRVELPAKLPQQARVKYGRELRSSDTVGVWCSPGSTAADAGCAVAGKIALANSIAAGAGGLTKANDLTSKLRNSSFFCKAIDSPKKGVCTYLPYFKRFNVLPTALEAVWYDQGEPPSADWQVYAASMSTPTTVTVNTGDCAATRIMALGQAPENLLGWGFGSID
jgi:hypothetical protein